MTFLLVALGLTHLVSALNNNDVCLSGSGDEYDGTYEWYTNSTSPPGFVWHNQANDKYLYPHSSSTGTIWIVAEDYKDLDPNDDHLKCDPADKTSNGWYAILDVPCSNWYQHNGTTWDRNHDISIIEGSCNSNGIIPRSTHYTSEEEESDNTLYTTEPTQHPTDSIDSMESDLATTNSVKSNSLLIIVIIVAITAVAVALVITICCYKRKNSVKNVESPGGGNSIHNKVPTKGQKFDIPEPSAPILVVADNNDKRIKYEKVLEEQEADYDDKDEDEGIAEGLIPGEQTGGFE